MASPPKDASQVRTFVQLIQYSAKFHPNFAQEAEPLRSLLRKNEPFIWGETQERSFQKLKQLVTQATTLAYYRGDCNMCIIANASPQGLAAVLEVNFKTASGEQSRTRPETSLKWNGDTVRLRKRPLP